MRTKSGLGRSGPGIHSADLSESSLRSKPGDEARIQAKAALLREEGFTTRDINEVLQSVPNLNVVLLRTAYGSRLSSMAQDAAALGGALNQPVVFKFNGLVTIATPGKDAHSLIQEHEERLGIKLQGKPGKMAA